MKNRFIGRGGVGGQKAGKCRYYLPKKTISEKLHKNNF